MENNVGTFAADLFFIEQQIEVMNSYLQKLAERERRMKALQAEITRLQEVIDDLRRHRS
jgi:cell division protein FtsB